MVATNLHSILANQTNVTLARNQRVVASWLPPPSPSEIRQSQDGLELDEEDGHTFVPELEFLGLGQALPKEFETAQASNLSSDAKLRRQLLGRGQAKLKRKRPNGGNVTGTHLPAAKRRDSGTDRKAHEWSSEDEPGRSALGRPVPAKSWQRMPSEDESTDNPEDHTGPDVASDAPQRSRAAEGLGKGRAKAPDVGTKHYLDQVLAEKARKMRKRRKRKTRKVGEVGENVQAT